MRFADKVCLVTGGGSGIGRATCYRFAGEGGMVAVVDIDEPHGRQTAATITGDDGQALFVAADVASPADVRAAVDQVVERWGRVDVLVNSAARMTFSPVASLEVEEWDGVLDTNLRSVFLFCKHCLPHMPRGAIVNLSSVHAHQTTARVAPYAASKGGIEAFTRALSRECGKDVRTNCVAPGAVDTPMLWSNPLVRSGEERIDREQLGRPEDVAAAIAFLASEDARLVNGTVLAVDGGRLAALA
jgi:glucose 1-dehydrogenase